MAQIPSGTKFIGIDASVPTSPERNGTRVNNMTEHYTVDDIAAFAGVGSIGPQGVEGPAGPPGPVGPAGLTWQGAWDADSQYAVNDAVGFNGASYFCILEITGTGNDNPESNTANWALLASQGADGVQGAQGPTGPQGAQGVQGIQGIEGPEGPEGPAGTAPLGTEGAVAADLNFPYPELEYTINRVFATASDNIYRVVLPTSTAVIGEKVIVSCISSNRVSVKAVQIGSGGIYINGVSNATVGEFYIYPNETYEFTYIGSGNWISYFEEPKLSYKTFKAFITQSGTNNPVIDTTSINTTGKTFTITKINTGQYEITPNTDFSNFKKVFVNLEIQSGAKGIGVTNQKITVNTSDYDGTPFDLIDYSYLSIEIYP